MSEVFHSTCLYVTVGYILYKARERPACDDRFLSSHVWVNFSKTIVVMCTFPKNFVSHAEILAKLEKQTLVFE